MALSTNAGVALEQCEALTDIRNVMQEYGSDVKLQMRVEVDIARDKYNSIKTPDATVDYTFKCYPIQENPTQSQMNKAGIYEKVDALVYSAMQDWILNGISNDNIDVTRDTVIWAGKTWNIKEKSSTTQIGDIYLYVVLGLTKK